MALRLRVTLVVAALTAVLVAGGSVAFALSMAAGTRATLEHSLERRGRRVLAQLHAHLLPVGPGSAHHRASADQSTVQVIDSAGRLAYTTAAAGLTPLLTRSDLAQARRGALWVQRHRPGWHSPRLALAEPAGAGTGAVVVVGGSLDQVVDTQHRTDLVLEIAGPLLVAAISGGAWLLAGSVLRPVERLRAQVQRIAASGSSERLVEPRTHDELAALAETFNGLLDRLWGALDRQRQFVAAASHELRTPLAMLGAELEMVARDGQRLRDGAPGAMPQELVGFEPLGEVSERLAGRVGELVRLSDGLLLLAQADEGAALVHVEPLPLEPIIAASLRECRAMAARQGVTMVLDADPLLCAPVDQTRVRQVVDNLVGNAIRFSPSGGQVAVGLHRAGSTVVLTVRDHGPGFPPDFLPRAFERFSRADPSRTRHRGGAGLGLAIVWTIARAHHGTASVANAADGGAVVTVTLSAAPTPGAPSESAPNERRS